MAEPPVIDVSLAIAAYGDTTSLAAPGSARATAAAPTVAAIAAACARWGFFQATNHAVDPALVAAFDAQMTAFFALPRAAKATIKRTAQNSRGWFDDELTKRTRDWKECLDIGRESAKKGYIGIFGLRKIPIRLLRAS